MFLPRRRDQHDSFGLRYEFHVDNVRVRDLFVDGNWRQRIRRGCSR